jgi:hypothetical protein
MAKNKTKRVQPNRVTVQFQSEDDLRRLDSMAKTRSLCVATLIRVYTMEGLVADERVRGVTK